jgi:hypothetical protein
MPYHTSFDRAGGFAVVTGFGANDYASSLAAMTTLSDDPAFEAGWGVLCDFRENAYTPSAEDARKLSSAFMVHLRGHPLAFVIAGPLQLGVANMIATLFELGGGVAAVFESKTEAAGWLSDSKGGRA